MHREPDLGADVQREVGDPAGVRRGVLVVRLQRVGESLDRREEGPLESLVARGALQRELGLAGGAAEQLQLAISILRRFPNAGGDGAPTPVDDEWSDREATVPALRWSCDRCVVGAVDEERLGPGEPRPEMLDQNRRARSLRQII